MKCTQRVEERPVTSQSQSMQHATNIYIMDSDEEAIVDIIKDHEGALQQDHENFKNKARKDCPVGEVCKQPQPVSKSV